MAADPMPTADVVVDEALVRRLLAEQHPGLASLPLTDPVIGWDNVMYRLGTELAVRLPRRLVSAPLIEREQRWLPELAPVLPLPIPAPLHVGRPGAGYPWSWSVCSWLPGAPAATSPPRDAHAAAAALGAFMGALHLGAPADAPVNPFRGVPLEARDDAMRARVTQLAAELDADSVLALWSEVLAVPAWTGPRVWLHGDLHPANVLVHDGEISAVIDFGDITSGDPATDLSVAWMMFGPGPRVTLRAAAGDVDDDTWARARGWALALAVAILAGSADNPVMQAIARRTLLTALTDA
jgi:aminoglycoside phosphotransferase (APT) family kinase protein